MGFFLHGLKMVLQPRRDSNPQSSDPKSDALSIRPRGQRKIQFAHDFCAKLLLSNGPTDTLSDRSKTELDPAFWGIFRCSGSKLATQAITGKQVRLQVMSQFMGLEVCKEACLESNWQHQHGIQFLSMLRQKHNSGCNHHAKWSLRQGTLHPMLPQWMSH